MSVFWIGAIGFKTWKGCQQFPGLENKKEPVNVI